MEHFYTLQGEGQHSGKAAYFIRLGGCNVGCVWCDVKDSWDADAHSKMEVQDIVAAAMQYPCRLAVITGGEPAMYDLTALCDALHEQGFTINIETSGAYPIVGDIDWVTLSPKKFKPPVQEALDKADELKVIIYHRSDFYWGEEHAKKVPANCKLYLQPEWGKKDDITPLVIKYILEHPEWEISLQTHKYINIP